MSPPWVLLDRFVYFIERGSAGGAGKAAAAIGKSSGKASLEGETAALKPDPVVADPPEVTSLSMLRHLHLPEDDLLRGTRLGTVSSTDKGLVVIYTRPGLGSCIRSGCYLVYDASSSSLSVVPQLERRIRLPSRPSIKSLGTSAAILRCRYGVYILAELVTSVQPGLPDAHLYLWRSSTPTGGHTPTGQWASLSSARQWLQARHWVPTQVCLPLPTELCGPTYFFHIDMAFAFGGTCVCWADLLAGVLICDLFAPQGPKFSCVPLPQECCSYSTPVQTRLETQESRSMGCVRGAIKFVAMVGHTEDLPKDQVVIKTWTLSPDLKEWKEGAALLVRDLYESESFREMELPRARLMNPVLSMNEDEIIYISLNDIDSVQTHDSYGQFTGWQLVLNGHYALRLDLLRNKVLDSKKSATNSLSLLRPVLLASDFSAYLHGQKDSQRGEEASKVGTMVKRTKY